MLLCEQAWPAAGGPAFSVTFNLFLILFYGSYSGRKSMKTFMGEMGFRGSICEKGSSW